MSLQLTDVQRIAHLARIELAPAEAEATLAQLNNIFGLIEQMQAVDTAGVAPLTTPLAALSEVALRLRDDVVTQTNQREAYQKPAPAVQDGLYLVPKVIE
jgi:aspartyl-tRNA(Asn)/glutamyl-tRNA(Gln) amidotransferase subunit C